MILPPFGVYGQPIDGVDFHRLLAASEGGGEGGSLDSYALSTVAAKAGKFAIPPKDLPPGVPGLGYAYHFDAGLYARYLRDYAETRGVKRTEGKIATVEQDPESGFVTGLTLTDGRRGRGRLLRRLFGFPRAADRAGPGNGFRGLVALAALRPGPGRPLRERLIR
ncbi:tryptophan 7-halogenase [Caulobacter segnis]